ncbi:MAG TPA: nucleotide exchange factor GrpE [Pyrinomonadaceae bacterium]|nr:nucleotide exchange factor GrpE [Pyrinomonadaceae bacterium]
MDPNKEIENIGEIADDAETAETVSVDDFIKQLEAKEKDLHITADTTIIEIASSFDDANLPDFLKEEFQLKKAASPSAAASASAKKPVPPSSAASEKEIAGLKEKISRMRSEQEELVQASLRRARDFENFKSRTERERNETFQSQIGNLATQMLPALDNLNRAVDFALAMREEQRTEIQPFLDGVILVSQQVNDVLGEMGIQPIATVGEIFDPHFHEAVATEESSDFGPNTVCAELLRGYRIGNRVIRASMVKVAKMTPGGEQTPTESSSSSAVTALEDGETFSEESSEPTLSLPVDSDVETSDQP